MFIILTSWKFLPCLPPPSPLSDFKMVLFSFPIFPPCNLCLCHCQAFLMSQAYHHTTYSPWRKNLPQQLKILPESCLFSADGPCQAASHAESCAAQGHRLEGGSQETAGPGRGIEALPFGPSGEQLGQTVFTPELSWDWLRPLNLHRRSTSPSAQSCCSPAFHKGLNPHGSQSLVLISSQSLLPGEPIFDHAVLVRLALCSVTWRWANKQKTGRV